MKIKVDELKEYIGKPVWDNRLERWMVIEKVVYGIGMVEMYSTDGSRQEFTQDIQETWLQSTGVSG